MELLHSAPCFLKQDNMIIRTKKKKNKKKRYTKKSIYDDLIPSNNSKFLEDPNSLAYKDFLAVKEFKEKMIARKIKIKQEGRAKKDKPNPEIHTLSRGEQRIFKYLTRKGHDFVCEKEFAGMRNYNNIGSLRIDFYLPLLNIAIEYDGIQHFKASKKFDTATCTLETRKANDRAKDLFCIKKGIKMIRISYKDYTEVEVILNNNGI